jgi:hypothetical protein
MIDKDRCTHWRSKGRAAPVFLSIFVVLVIAMVPARSRGPGTISPGAPSAHMPAATHPAVGGHAYVPPSTVDAGATVEVCGYGNLPIDNKDPGAIFRRIGELTKGAATRWLSALQNSDDLRARMAGLLLEGKVTGGEPLRPATAQTRDEAVQLAAGSEDPAVYAMAILMCESSPAADADSACGRLSLQRWAQMDPDNAAPWLLLAGKARARQDGAAESDAFSHAATAHEIDSYSGSAFAFAEPEFPHDATPLERSYLAIEAVGVETATGFSQYSIALHHCSADAMPDNIVRRQCGSLAELLVTKGSNLLDLGVGTSIGARAGWPTARVNKLMLEQHALMQAIMNQAVPYEDKPWACDAVSRVDAYLRRAVRLGELGAAREVLDRSGDSVETMAQKFSQNTDNIKREASRREQENSQQTAQ